MMSDVYARRRARLLERLGQGVAVIPAASTHIRNHDVEHTYRQHSDFFYLTGLDEPQAVCVLSNVHPEHRFILFIRPRDEKAERWDGSRVGVEGARSRFGADMAYPIAEFKDKLADYLKGAPQLVYRLGEQRDFDSVVLESLNQVRKMNRRGVIGPRRIVEPIETLHEMRLIKDQQEVDLLQAAATITGDAHVEAMRNARPGMFEYEIEALLLAAFRKAGSPRLAYDNIVASGANATVLHYRRNDRKMQDGDLLLIDAGAEFEYYASDLTRTFPISGKFSVPQRSIYDLVLAAQLAAIEAVKPSATLDDVHHAALHTLVQGLLDLGLLKGTFDQALEGKLYEPYFMHRTSHWLGMDVHDVGDYTLQGKPRPLAEGMVLTVEPGLYIAEDADVDPIYHGIGVRIEDTVVVVAGGAHNLSANVPKKAEDIEAVMATR